MMKKKKTMLCVLFVLLVVIVVAIYFYPMGEYITHQIKIRKSLSENIDSEISLNYGINDHFLIDCCINENYKISLIIDNKATCLMRKDSILKYGGVYWNKLPIRTSNAYNIKSHKRLYEFKSIGFGKVTTLFPLFSAVEKEELIYKIVSDGVLGSDLLAMGCWKFDTDNNKIRFFHYKNVNRMEHEIDGLIKINKGLENDKIPIQIEGIEQNIQSTLDLGYAGVIEINNKTTENLKQKYDYQTISILRENGMMDIQTIFENLSISIAGIKVDTCQLVNIRSVDDSYIGAKFMSNFNFLLMYGEENKHICKHLYLQKNNKQSHRFRKDYISKFGFNVDLIHGKFIITSILQNGLAENTGLKLGDEITQLNKKTWEQLKFHDISHDFIRFVNGLNQLELAIKDKGKFVLNTE